MWARNSQELFYRAPDDTVMGLRIEASATWAAGPPTRVIAGRYYRAAGFARQFDVSPDGRRFLMIKSAADTGQPSPTTDIVIVQNWFEELKRLVPTNRSR